MKKIFIAAAAFLLPVLAQCAQPPEIKLFYSPHCSVCIKLKKEFLPEIKQKYGGSIVWKELNIDEDKAALAEFYAVAARHKKEKPAIPAIEAGNYFFVGKKEISLGLDMAIKSALASGAGSVAAVALKDSGDEKLRKVFGEMSALAVVGAGLIDGINPCAFAVIVFFVSFLAVYGYSRKEIVIVGCAYCAAVFITYLLIGLGVFKVLYSLGAFYRIMQVFYWMMAGFCFILFGLSIYDFWLYKKTGVSQELLLQLPSYLKVRAHRIIGDNLRGQEHKSAVALAVSSLGVGFLVSLIEAVCTGQVYVPTIVFIMKNPQLRVQAFGYLLLYNLMFVLPLVGVFLLSLAGYQSERFSQMLKQNLGAAKLMLAAVFLGLGFLLILNI